MKIFTPTINTPAGELTALCRAGAETIYAFYQNASQSPAKPRSLDDVERFISLSEQMASMHRGAFWFTGDAIISLYDWQPNALRARLTLDSAPSVSDEQRIHWFNALTAELHERYHLRNFCYPSTTREHWLHAAGFSHQLTERHSLATPDGYTDQHIYQTIITDHV